MSRTDTFICGVCDTTFTDLSSFLNHKLKESCYMAINPDTKQQITSLAGSDAGDASQAANKAIKNAEVVTGAEQAMIVVESENTGRLKVVPLKDSSVTVIPMQGASQTLPAEPIEQSDIHELNVEIVIKSKETSHPDNQQRPTDDVTSKVFRIAGSQMEITGVKRKRGRPTRQQSDPSRELKTLKRKKIVADYIVPQSVDDIPDIPIFPTEEARRDFETKFDYDLSSIANIEGMYSCHVIQQGVVASRMRDITLYSCNKCEKVFKSLHQCNMHCITHLDHKPFKCTEENCHFRCNTKGNLYTHMRKHTGQYYKCQTCPFKTVNKTHLFEHESTHSGISHSCTICKRIYSTQRSLVNHVRKYHADSEEGKLYLSRFITKREGPGAALLYECHICDLKFKKLKDRDKHLQIHNVNITPCVNICPVCSYEAVKITQLHSHIIQHDWIYRCNCCLSRFPSVIRLLSHINKSRDQSHTEYEGMTVTTIPAACIQVSLYINAYRKITENAIEQPENSKLDSELSAQDMFTKLGFKLMTEDYYKRIRLKGDDECEFCGSRFKDMNQFDKHLIKHCGERQFECVYCSHRTSSKNSLRTHVTATHSDFTQLVCYVCKFKPPNSTAAIDHMEATEAHKQMKCPKCPLKFFGRKMLRDHLSQMHKELGPADVRSISGYGRHVIKRPNVHDIAWGDGGKKAGSKNSYFCNSCDYSSTSKCNLRSHMLRHMNMQPFQCTVCVKRYKSRTALRWHIRSHGGTSFNCPHCPYKGTQHSHLKRHLETHNIRRKFTCNHCMFSSNTVSYMKRHYSRNHQGLSYDTSARVQHPADNEEQQNVHVYRCGSCDFLFGNMSDMRRHLREKHRINVLNMKRDDNSNQTAVTQFLPVVNADGITSQVQVIEESQLTDSSFPMLDESQITVHDKDFIIVLTGQPEITDSHNDIISLHEQSVNE